MTTDFSPTQIRSGYQTGAQSILLPDGKFALIWQDNSQSGDDTDGWSVRGRVFQSDGAPVSDQFTINTSTIGDQLYVRLAAMEGGRFVVAWMDREIQQAKAQVFGSDGTASGAEFSISDAAQPTSLDLSGIIARPSGGFSVLWKSRLGTDGAAYFQRLDENGAAQSDLLELGDSGNFTPGSGLRAIQTDTGFLASWQDRVLGPQFQFFSRYGNQKSDVIDSDVKFWASSHQHDFDILPNGNIVVVSYYGAETVDGSLRISMEAQVLASDGSSVVDAFQVDSRVMGSLESADNPDVLALSDGGFLVLWKERISKDLLAKRFDATGTAVGDEFRINVTDYSYGAESIEARQLDDGRVLITWNQWMPSYDVAARIINLDFRKPLGVGGETETGTDSDGYYAADTGFFYKKSGGDFHNAEDWNGDIGSGEDGDSDEGDAVFAFGSGEIVQQKTYASRLDLTKNYGKTLVLDHTQDTDAAVRLYSFYAHLKKNDVFSLHDNITVGDKIGSLGGTGDKYATTKYSAHLHFSVFEALNYSDGIFGINGLGGASVTAQELTDAQSVTYDASGNVSSILLGSLVGTDYKFVRYYSSDYFINVASGRERIYDFEAEDQISVTARTGGVHYELFGLTGDDTLRAGSLGDLLSGGSQNDTLFGYGGADVLYGDQGRDELRGGRGDDTLFGGRGNDTLIGGNGRDILSGDNGDDTQTGGKGGDTFIFSSGEDVITDFDTGNDREKIDLTAVASITGFRDLKINHSSEIGGNLVIDDLAGNRLTLNNVLLADLEKADFIF